MKYLVLFIINISSIIGISQSEIISCPAKMQVLYVGVNNPIYFSSEVSIDSNYSIVSNCGDTLIWRRTNIWTIVPRKAGTLRFYIIKENGEKVKLFQEYRVKRIPDPIATVGGTLLGGMVSGGKFKAQLGIVAVLKNFDFDFRYSVKSYHLNIKKKDGKIIDLDGIGPIFKDEIRSQIRDAKMGDSFSFKSIIVKGDDGSSRSLSDISFIITD